MMSEISDGDATPSSVSMPALISSVLASHMSVATGPGLTATQLANTDKPGHCQRKKKTGVLDAITLSKFVGPHIDDLFYSNF